MSNEISLLAVERQQKILEILKREGVIRTAELCELLAVSTVTIRSDLRELEKAGECEIIWGGAVSTTPPLDRARELEHRTKLHADSKQRMGIEAVKLIEVGQTIILDAGTSTVELVNNLPHDMEYLRVVTPALNVAVATTYYPYIELVMPGGVLRNLTRSLVGPQTIRSLELFNADWLFLATTSFDIEHGVTTGNILEVEVKRTMVNQAKRIVLLADGSKFGRVSSLNVVQLKSIDILITDDQLSSENVHVISDLGVQVLRV